MDGHKFFIDIMQSSPFQESILKCNDGGDITINGFGITVGPWLFKDSLMRVSADNINGGKRWIVISMHNSPRILFEITNGNEMFIRDGGGATFSIASSIARHTSSGQITFGTNTSTYHAISYMFRAIITTHRKMFEGLVSG